MSLLGNRNNDFEKKLKKQLGDTELKPSESLWDRIDKEVNRPEFEQKVEGKIGKYEVKPKPETWTYIEEQLPPEPSRWKRAGKLWYVIAILLFFGGAFAGYQLSNLPDGETADVPSVTIESARQGSQEIKEIVGGTDQQSEVTAAENLYAGRENTLPADKIAVKETEKPTSTGSTVPSVANETIGLTSEVTAANTSAPRQTSAQTAHARVATGVQTKQNPVKPALSQHKSNGTKHNQEPPAPEVIASNDKKRNQEPVIAANTALNPAVAVADNSSKNNNTGKTSDNNALLAQAGERSTVDTGHTEVDVTAKQSKANDPGKPATGQEPGSLNSSIAPGNKEGQPKGSGISDQTVTSVTSETPSSAGIPDDTSKVADKPAVSGKPLQALNDSMVGTIPADFKQIETQAPTRLSITIMAGVHQSYMKLVAPDHKNMDENVALRRQTEMPKMDFSGGFLVDYEASPRVLISSGIIFTGFSMSMKYNITPASKEASPEPGATYTNASDSIEQGSGMNNRIHYSWNEIPLFITFRLNSPSKRFGLETRTGVSYAMLNAVDAAMVGQENIGVLLLKNKESFPHMKNSFFVHLYAGVSYQINESVALQLMPYFRYSLSNMIDNENWVKQYPWMVGVNFGLRKSF